MKTNDTKTEITTGKELTIWINRLPITHDKIVGYDFQGDSLRSQSKLVTSDEIVGHDASGWPLYQLRVISLLRAIGIPEDIINQVPDDILTTHISTLDEDDVGHVTNEQKVINCNIDKEHGIVYLWV